MLLTNGVVRYTLRAKKIEVEGMHLCEILH